MRLWGWWRATPSAATGAAPNAPLVGAHASLFGAAAPTAVAESDVSPITPPPAPAMDEPAPPPAPASSEPPPVVPSEFEAPWRYHPDKHDDFFRVPRELAVNQLSVKRVLVVGSCFSAVMPIYLGFAFPNAEFDHILFGNVGVLPEPPQPLDSYDFQLIMLDLRGKMPEQLYSPLSYSDVNGYQAAFETAREMTLQSLHGALAYCETSPITTFVANYMTPQQNAMGRLLPRYDLRNPVYFVEQLNRCIADEISGRTNVHLFDLDQISANFGRKYFQDDLISVTSHHSYASDYDHEFDQQRLEKIARPGEYYQFRLHEFFLAIGRELHAMLRTLRQIDQVKLVIVDLDDTLWRGVVAEDGIDRPMVIEGWPAGFIEALNFLKKRGILLAIASKNDETRIRELWPALVGSRLELTDFASIKINWNPKPDNIEQILTETNLLPRNVVYIDDNPVERAAVGEAFPGMRMLGSNPYYLRRVLLWAAETQVAYITDESSRRTEMIRAQVERETSRTRMSRADFLQTLDVRIRLFQITDTGDPRFARAFELINKSNQFNTTGRRWKLEEVHAGFAAGLCFWAFEVDDRFTNYGIVGVAVVGDGVLEQFVMSCRVVGLEVELAVIGEIVGRTDSLTLARYTATEANLLCRDLFARCGFVEAAPDWQRPAGWELPRPIHIRGLDLQ